MVSVMVLVSFSLLVACQRGAAPDSSGTTTTQASSGSEPLDPAAATAVTDADAGGP